MNQIYTKFLKLVCKKMITYFMIFNISEKTPKQQ